MNTSSFGLNGRIAVVAGVGSINTGRSEQLLPGMLGVSNMN